MTKLRGRTATARRRTPPPSGATRDATLWPYSVESPFALPLASTATLEAVGGPMTTNIRATSSDVIGPEGTSAGTITIWFNQNTLSHPISYAAQGETVRNVEWMGINDRPPSSATPIRTFQAAVPLTAVVAGGDDKHSHTIDPDRRYVHEMWDAAVNGTKWQCRRYEKNDLHGDGVSPQAGWVNTIDSTDRNGTRAYGGSAIAGLVRTWEYDPAHPDYVDGVIRHPIAVALRSVHLKLGPVWPATEQDSTANGQYYGELPMGSLIVLDPSVDVDATFTTPAGRALARAYQDYGAYVVDRAGAFVAAYVEYRADLDDSFFATSANRGELNTLRANLRVVTNNAAATPGGGTFTGDGSNRRRPLAPPVGTGGWAGSVTPTPRMGVGSTGATSLSPTYPAGVSGEDAYVAVTTRSGATIETPAGCTVEVAPVTGGSMTFALYKVTAPVDAGTAVPVTVTLGDSSCAMGFRLRSGVTIVASTTGVDTTSGTSYSATGGTVTCENDDRLLGFVCYSNNSVEYAAGAFTFPAGEVGPTAPMQQLANATGSDSHFSSHTSRVVTGGSGAPTWAGTFIGGQAGTGITCFLVTRPAPTVSRADLSMTPDSYRAGGNVILAGRGTSTSPRPWIGGYEWATSHGTLTGLGSTWMQPRLDLTGIAAGTAVTLQLRVTDLAGNVSPWVAKTLTVTPAVAATHTFPQDGTDQSTAIAAAINGLPAGGTIVFEPGASYNVQTIVNVSNRTDITVDGNGARFYKNAGTDIVNDSRVLQFQNCTGLTLRNVEVQGGYTNPSLTHPYVGQSEAGAGVALLSCAGMTVENVYSHNHFGDTLFIRRQGTSGGTNSGEVRRTWLDKAGRQGLACTHGDGLMFTDCTIRNARLKNWDPEPENGNWTKMFTLQWSQIGESGSDALGANGRPYNATTGEAGAVLEDITVTRCLFDLDMRWGQTQPDPETGPLGKKIRRFAVLDNVALQQARDCTVTATDLTDCNDPVLILRGIEGLTVTGNRQVLPANGNGWIVSTESTSVVDTENVFT